MAVLYFVCLFVFSLCVLLSLVLIFWCDGFRGCQHIKHPQFTIRGVTLVYNYCNDAKTCKANDQTLLISA